jgi:hypothetical protein
MHTHITAVATAKLNVDLSQHLDCFYGRGFEITEAAPSSLRLRFPAGTSLPHMRDCFAAGLIGLLIKVPDSGASWALAEPIRIKVGGKETLVSETRRWRRRSPHKRYQRAA